ncbi:hypothetical protein [Comamonas testosteroni]|uniref:hypothetical protein n=1 Tax=Comamonas testosteroni TaxID=285 RepID=UPI0009B868CC|nr:hypothetical protein [Comamonas testosteroni]
MAIMKSSDLQYGYSWTAIKPDDPKVSGKPDSTFLNRGEGYEVLPFINRFAEKHGFKNLETGKKIETMIKKHLPGDVRSHANVTAWLEANWKSY